MGLKWVELKDAPSAAPARVDLSPIWPRMKDGYAIEPGARSRLARDAGTKSNPMALSEDEHGWIVAGSRWGSGSAIMFCHSGAARNEALLTADHDALLVHLALVAAGGGKVGFDEYHHGYAEGQGPLAYVMDSAAGPAVVHVVLLLFLLVLATRRRLGPARIVREEERRRPLEFIEALARLCRASGNSGLAVRLVLADVLDSIQERFGGSDPQTLARVSARLGLDGRKVGETVEAARRASEGRPGAGELVRQVRELERIRMALAKGR